MKHQLTKRQNQILLYIQNKEGVSNKEILGFINSDNDPVSRISIIRDINCLILQKLIKKTGQGRSVRYVSEESNLILKFIDPSAYFKTPVDLRNLAKENFDFSIFKNLSDIFSGHELENLKKLSAQYKKRVKSLSSQILEKERERLTIELSWKSSQIEGNTYSLLDTEVLIKQHKEAEGHTKEEALMIMNHKKALDYVFSHPDAFTKISIAKIEDLHRLLLGGLNVVFGLRKKPVGVIGTKYRPLDNQHQIRESMEKLVKMVNNEKNVFNKALIAILLVSYIQPFDDGNKRTGRILGNALLVAYGVCPLSYRSVDEIEYKKAILLFYEQQSALYFKELFIKQYEFAVKNYFL